MMPADYRLTLEERPGYLHARVTGERTPENALRFLKDVNAACQERGIASVLLEMALIGPSLKISSIFDVISARSPEGSKLRRIAYVEASEDTDKARFAETVAKNRGVNVRLFSDVESAVRWLSE